MLFEVQELTEAEKATVRNNIGAVTVAEVLEELANSNNETFNCRTHWILLIVSFEEKTIYYADSLNYLMSPHECDMRPVLDTYISSRT